MDEQTIQTMSEWNNIKATIQTSQFSSLLDCKIAYLTSFHTISKCFTNFVDDRHRFFVFKFIRVNNNPKTCLDASVTEINQYMSQKCEASWRDIQLFRLRLL